jgi:hypothetical protein
VIVDDTPKFLTSDPTDHTHALTIKDPGHPTQTVILPLALRGVTSLLNMSAPALDEWNSDIFKRLHLTSESLTWDPTTTLYEEQETAMIDYSGHVVTTTLSLGGHANHLVINLLSSLTADKAEVTDDNNVYSVLASHVQISSIETSLNGHIRLCKTVPIDPHTLATRWIILGCYLGPAIDTGSTLTAKNLKSNGVFVCRSTLRHLMDEELSSSVHKDMSCKFDESIEHHLGPAAPPQDSPVKT